MGTSVERRATKRFQIRLPITVRWTNRSGIGEARTESEDISSGGVYFIPPEPWWPQAADLMVRHDLSLREAAAELGVDLTNSRLTLFFGDGLEILSLPRVSY
jgi:hypothetical protein